MPSFGQRKRTSGDVDVEIDMVPVMNMFLVLIPFLLMSSSFLHLKAINTSVPVKSTQASEQLDPKKSDIKLTIIVDLAGDKMAVSATSEELTEAQLQVFDKSLAKKAKADYPFAEFTQTLAAIKAQYPKSDTVIIMPDDAVKYNDIIKTMDAARQQQNQAVLSESDGANNSKLAASAKQVLFPHVVLSAKAG